MASTNLSLAICTVVSEGGTWNRLGPPTAKDRGGRLCSLTNSLMILEHSEIFFVRLSNVISLSGIGSMLVGLEGGRPSDSKTSFQIWHWDGSFLFGQARSQSAHELKMYNFRVCSSDRVHLIQTDRFARVRRSGYSVNVNTDDFPRRAMDKQSFGGWKVGSALTGMFAVAK